MTEREKIFKALNALTEEHKIAWEVNFDDFELLSINFVYRDESENQERDDD